MLNHRTWSWSRRNTQAQGRHGREATPGTQGLLGITLSGGAPPCDQTVTNPSQPGWNRLIDVPHSRHRMISHGHRRGGQPGRDFLHQRTQLRFDIGVLVNRSTNRAAHHSACVSRASSSPGPGAVVVSCWRVCASHCSATWVLRASLRPNSRATPALDGPSTDP
jgi:hypothetical protein